MMVLKAHPLVAGQTFQHKEILQICIAEEMKKISISFHNVGTHLLDLRNTATQANTKNVRGNMM
jgi:hypothetical protein